MTGECPVGCGCTIDAGKLMCRPCWLEVPRHLKRDVLRTWAKYRRLPVATDVESHRVRREARLAYQAARDAAIGSIR